MITSRRPSGQERAVEPLGIGSFRQPGHLAVTQFNDHPAASFLFCHVHGEEPTLDSRSDLSEMLYGRQFCRILTRLPVLGLKDRMNIGDLVSVPKRLADRRLALLLSRSRVRSIQRPADLAIMLLVRGEGQVPMRLFYDPRDDAYHERLGSQLLYWLDDLDAAPFDEADPTAEGFLFAGARSIADYRQLVQGHPLVRDRPCQREPLLRLDSVLKTLEQHGVRVPMPRTWVLPLDTPLPTDLAFPLFVRTAESSWKKGGHYSRARTVSELEDEAALLRRSLGWDAIILARQWLDLAVAGDGRHGPLPQEIRTWVVDGVPLAWSFHYMNIIERPKGFPPPASDLAALRRLAGDAASAFGSRLVVADFARGVDGRWWFIEAGPGSCGGTSHEAVFKAVARSLKGEEPELHGDALGGPL